MTRSNYPRGLFGPGEPHESRTDPGLSFWLGRLRIAEPQRADALEVWPLLIDGDVGKPLVLLHQALAAGTIEVLEQGGGSVNQVWRGTTARFRCSSSRARPSSAPSRTARWWRPC